MADYKGLNIRFSANTTDASKALHILGNEAKNAQGNLNRIQDALKNTKTNGDALNATLKQFQLEQLGKQADVARQKFEAYRDLLPQLKDKHAELRAEIESTKAAMEGGEVKLFKDDGTAMSMKELAAHLNSVEEQERKTAAAIESATGNMLSQQSAAQSLAAEHTRLAASMDGIGKWGTGLKEFGDNLQKVGSDMSSIGDKMSIVSGIAAMAFGRKIVSSTEEFGNAISQLGGYLDINGTQLEDMSQQALKWGKDTQFSATEAANAMNELAKGGMTQAQISGGAMEATMQLAAAGSLDMAQAAETAVQAIKTFRLPADQASKVADALAGAANKSTAEVTDLAQGFKYVGGWASMANWNINDVSGALALLSDHGLQSEMAGTALRNVMQRLAAPTTTAAKLMNQYGFSVRDSNGQMVSAVEMVQRLNDTFGQLGDQEKQEVLSKIFGARALPAAVALMNEGADSLQNYIDATTEAGYAEEMAKNRMGELGWALEYLKGEAETAAVNFGTALTPTIRDVANAIEDALTWFNGLSKAQQESIAQMALFVTAAGPVMSVVGHMSDGIGGFISALSKEMVNIGAYNNKLAETGSVAQAMTVAFEGSTLPLAAMAASIGATALAINEYADEMELIGDATRDASDIANEAREAVRGMADEYGTAGESMKSLAEATRESNESLKESSEYKREVADSLKEMENGAASAEHYASVIKELADSGNLTASQQERLKDAVSKYNEITGAAIEITNSQRGNLNMLVGNIDKVTDAYIRQAQTSAYAKLYNEAVEEQIRTQKALRDAVENTKVEISGVGDVLSAVMKGGSGLLGAGMAEVMGASESFNGLAESAKSASNDVEYFKQKLESSTTTSDEFNQMLNDMGIAAKSTGGDLTGMGEDAEEASQQAAQSMEEASKAAQKALKRQQEAIYRDAQRGYDAEYKALQRSLDAEYKAQQKAYDAEYKALQKQLDRQYKERQKAFDKEYKQRQKELDKQYDAYKKRLDSEEDALKKSLDAKYDQRKKALDAELAQIKKANDARLKEQKKADDAETKAFKAETDRRVKALQAEYKERLRLLELQYGGSDIDAQIKSLKDQTKAEQDEIKRRNEAEKKAELEKAVEQAKTRRKRADAEKALKDYLEELAQEQRENEREAQIERLEEQKDMLKDELQAKKDALKEEYDARIEALKSQREAELEVIKEANDVEYETLKEQLEARYQARKEANDARLEQIKEANQLEIDNLKEHHSVLLENMKERHAEQLELLKEQQQEQLDQIKEGQQLQLDGLKESQQAQLDALKESQQAQLDALKEAQQGQLDTLKQAQQDALQALKDSQEDEMDALKAHGESAKAEVQKKLDGIVSSTLYSTSKAAAAVGDGAKTSKESVIKSLEDTMIRGGTASRGVNDAIMRELRSLKTEPGNNTKQGMDAMKREIDNARDPSGQKARSVVNAISSQTGSLQSAIGSHGLQAMSSFASGIRDGGRNAETSASNIARGISSELRSPANSSGSWGWDMLNNFNNSIVNYWNNTLSSNISNIAQGIRNMLGHSTPKEGPLKGDDVWFYHLMQNLDDGLKRGTPMLMGTVDGIAQGVSDGMSADFMDEMLDGMRSKESELASQSRRMAEIVTENFNPYANGNYSVGYDVKPMAQLLTNGVTEALRSGIPQRQGATIIVKEMHVRDESDIRRVSQRLYQLEAQSNRRGL